MIVDDTTLKDQERKVQEEMEYSASKRIEPLELDICFWDMNPKEHLWSRLKALELFETANILLMVYNADDRDSFEKIQLIHNDFKESNKVGAYQVLVSIITNDVKNKKVPKQVKKAEA